MVVGVYADRLGRGPTKARTYIIRDLVVCLLEDTMQRSERVLLESGAEKTLSTVRSQYQEAIREELCEGIERLAGRRVAVFISGNNLEPDICSELFLLDEPPDAHGEPEGRRPVPAAKLVHEVD